MDLPNPATEARRLVSDPAHLRRKAAYIRQEAARGGALQQKRLDRAAELESQADAIEAV